MRVFVTGATGYIGKAVCAALQRRGHDVVGLARSQTAIDALLARGVHPVQGDLRDARALREMTHDADAVIYVGFEQSRDGVAIEAAALESILAAIDNDHEAFIYTSGVWVYGATGDGPATEDSPLDPVDLVKWRPPHERLVLDGATHRLRTVVIRPGLVYGHGGGIPGTFVASGKREGVVRIVGDGSNRWPLVEVDALADLYVRALDGAQAGSVYNGVTAAPVTMRAVALAAAAAAGVPGAIESIPIEQARQTMGPFADALALDQVVSAERARTELGWEPAVPDPLEAIARG